MLFQELGKLKRTWIMSSVIMIAIGVVMILCPVRYMGMLVSALGYVLLVAATVMILDFLSSKKALMDYISLTVALAIGLLGMWVMVNRRDVLPMLGLIFGIVLLISGLGNIYSAFVYTRRAGRASWIVLALLALVTIVLGVLVLINPWWDTPYVLKEVIGCMLLFSSVVSIIRVILTWPFRNA